MLPIPGGTFLTGSLDEAGDPDEHPQHSETVGPFRMDVTEVTVSAYSTCVQSGKCTPAANDSSPCNYGKEDKGNHPTNCVDWGHADTFCRAQGKRLPTEEEWEYAALGSDGRIYPWGNDAPIGKLCWKEVGTCAVGSFPGGRSPFGLVDMAGNVWERTSAGYSDDYSQSRSTAARVTRGGGWQSNQPSDVRGANRGKVIPSHRPDIIGFRCASDAGTTAATARPPVDLAPAGTPVIAASTVELAPDDQGFVDSRGGAGWGDRCFTLKWDGSSSVAARCGVELAHNAGT